MASSDHPRPFRVLATQANPPAIQVEVDRHYRPHMFADNPNVWCLTQETFSLAQFAKDVDELIEELQSMKQEAAGLFAAHKRRGAGSG